MAKQTQSNRTTPEGTDPDSTDPDATLTTPRTTPDPDVPDATDVEVDPVDISEPTEDDGEPVHHSDDDLGAGGD